MPCEPPNPTPQQTSCRPASLFQKSGLILGAFLICLIGLSGFPAGHPPDHAGGKERHPAMAANWQPEAILRESWTFYKGRFLVDGAHVVSNTYGGTISEGQSYALLKAVWMDDPEVFQAVWQWTREHMRRPSDHLLGWRWGDGQFGTRLGLMEADNATDADQDIAYALLLAGERWRRPDYTQDALGIIGDLWRLNVEKIGGRYYLVPGTWTGFRQDYLTLNPSYFAPYVYRKFAMYDRAHSAGWSALADDIYDTLETCTQLTQTQTPPNWCAIPWGAPGKAMAQDVESAPGNKLAAEALPIGFSDRQGEGSRDFSYDAFRVYWRMAMDARLSPSPGKERAMAYLKRHVYPLTYRQKTGTMPEGFTWDGKPRGNAPSGFLAGPVLTIARFRAPGSEAALYQALLASAYHPEGYWFNDYNDYLHSVIWLHLYALAALEHPATVDDQRSDGHQRSGVSYQLELGIAYSGCKEREAQERKRTR